jgi:hypothetical protein
MDDLGDQVAYLVLELGTPIYSSDEQHVGDVAQIRADDGKDIFDGLVYSAGGEDRYIRADAIEAIYERGVALLIDADACEQLGPPPGT